VENAASTSRIARAVIIDFLIPILLDVSFTGKDS
jgi:hypothetical protein